MIHARLLGSIELDLDGGPPPAPLRWKKHLGLLLLLWCTPGRRVPRDRALAMLWGDRGEQEARHSLNEALRVIRKHAGADAIATNGDLLQWTGSVVLDCDAFEQSEHADPVRAAAVIRGAWCDGFAVADAAEFEQWLEDERRAWGARMVVVLAAASDRLADRGELDEALALANRARRLDPLGEAAIRSHVRTLALRGDRVAAIREAEEFVRRLQAELGIAAAPETTALLRRLADERGAAPAPRADATDGRSPLVGREHALRVALAALRGALDEQRSTFVLIDGDPGSGRTRMLEELARRGALDGMRVLMVRAVPSDRDGDLAGFRAIADAGLAALPGSAGIASAALGVLVEHSPGWAERFPDPGQVDGPRPTLAAAVVSALRAAASEKPLLVILDDLEWFDDASIAQLPDVLRQLFDVPCLVVSATHRGTTGSALDALRRHLDRPGRGAHIRLDPLDLEALRAAVAAALPGWDATAQDRLARRLLAESAGLPAVAIGVLSAVAVGLELDELTDAWPAVDRTFDATLPARLPDPLTAAIRLRYHQLRPTSRELLALLAVHEDVMAIERLAAATELPASTIEAELDHLERERWVVADARGYRFRARAVGTLVAREMLTPGQRQRLQRRLSGP